jgi:hypothetical protein
MAGKSQRGSLPFERCREKLRGELSPLKDLGKVSEGRPPPAKMAEEFQRGALPFQPGS